MGRDIFRKVLTISRKNYTLALNFLQFVIRIQPTQAQNIPKLLKYFCWITDLFQDLLEKITLGENRCLLHINMLIFI